jgi:hypothetical protein
MAAQRGGRIIPIAPVSAGLRIAMLRLRRGRGDRKPSIQRRSPRSPSV